MSSACVNVVTERRMFIQKTGTSLPAEEGLNDVFNVTFIFFKMHQ